MAKKKDETEVTEAPQAVESVVETTEAAAEKKPAAKKAASPKKAKARVEKNPLVKQFGKRGAAIRDGLDPAKAYGLSDAVKLLKGKANAKFDETLNLAVNLGIDPTDTNNVVRGVVPMPNGLGKKVRVGVFAKGPKAEEAKKAGADIVGEADLADSITAGKIEFDVLIATPDLMGVVGKVAKILGPKGLMPNPKLGTVTVDVEKAIKAAKSGQVEFRADKGGIVHGGLGKASFSDEALIQNIKAFVAAVGKAKPATAKGAYFKKATLSTTMGVGVRLDIADLTAEAA